MSEPAGAPVSGLGKVGSHAKSGKKPKAERPAAALNLVPFKKQVGRLEQLVRTEIDDLAQRGNPVIVGPFLGEVGFELLYWIPMVRWVVREFPELRERLVIVSRGGARHWYGSLGARYLDVLSIWSVDEFHRVRSAVDKQRDVWEVEHDLVARVKELASVPDADLLHPSLLYRTYYLARKVDNMTWPRTVRQADGGKEALISVYEPMSPPDLGPLAGRLPESYVALRFYSRPSFPETAATHRFAGAVARSLARKIPVVLLSPKLELDDHDDLEPEFGEAVTTIDDLMDPTSNLHLQTAVIGRARAFIGTYGGLSYLAPFLKVPSLGFSTQPEHTHPWHLELAQRVFEGPDWGSLVALRPEDLDIVSLVADAPGTTRGAATDQ